jgi:hypothetical protein
MIKRLIFAAGILIAASNLQAQGLFNKVKNKVANVVDKSATNHATNAVNTTANNTVSNTGTSSDIKYTNPSKFGKVVMKYSAKEVEAHMGGESGGGFDLYFTAASVVNKELQLKIAEYNTTQYSYTGGQLQKIPGAPGDELRRKFYKGSEGEQRSKDFTNLDYSNAIAKSGGHVQGGQVPGKIAQDYTFKGKKFASFSSGALAHNADSTVVAVVGMSFAGGKVIYSIASSGGINYTLPSPAMWSPLISPDGRVSAAISATASGTFAYVSNGNKVTLTAYKNDEIWLRNSGSIFYADDNSVTALYKDGVLFYTFNMLVDLNSLFISKDDKRMCWQGKGGLYFSDGSIFRDAESPFKITIGDKEVIVFLVINVQNGDLYLCQHDL